MTWGSQCLRDPACVESGVRQAVSHGGRVPGVSFKVSPAHLTLTPRPVRLDLGPSAGSLAEEASGH